MTPRSLTSLANQFPSAACDDCSCSNYDYDDPRVISPLFFGCSSTRRGKRLFHNNNTNTIMLKKLPCLFFVASLVLLLPMFGSSSLQPLHVVDAQTTSTSLSQPIQQKISDTVGNERGRETNVDVVNNEQSTNGGKNVGNGRRRIGTVGEKGEGNGRAEKNTTNNNSSKRRRRRRMNQSTGGDNSSSPDNAAQGRLRTFFDNLRKLQQFYGSDVVTVRDASEAYPMLSQSHGDNTIITDDDCPFDYRYVPWQDDGETEGGGRPRPPRERDDADDDDRRPKPCYTPVITVHDRAANSRGAPPHRKFNAELPEVLLLSGLDSSPREMDAFGPMSIFETLRLLLECARCESSSPWIANDDAGEDENDDLWDGSTDDAFDEENAIQDDGITMTSSSVATNAVQCRRQLASQGIDDATRKWLARLVATRRIVAVPIADVAGFHEKLMQSEKDWMPRNDDILRPAMGGAICDFPFPFRGMASADNNNNNNVDNKQSTSNRASSCMATYPARVMNEVIRSHSFRLGLAFHGKFDLLPVEVPTPWIEVPRWKGSDASTGSNNGNSNSNGAADMTIDDKAIFDISWAYAKFAGTADTAGVRQERPMVQNNDCHGSMLEHFAFSAGMVEGANGVNNEGSLRLQQCQCNDVTTCAYPSEQTGLYDGSSLRTLLARVVTPSMQHHPTFSNMPGFDPSFDPSNPLDHPGYSLRDPTPIGDQVRMSLLATELVEPYAAIRSVAGIPLRDDDIIPQSPRAPGACVHTRVMDMPESSSMSNVAVAWTVGGALEVAETAIMYGKWDVLDKKIFDCVTQPTKQELDAFFTILRDFEVMEGETAEEMAEDVSFTSVQSGVTRWHSSKNNNIDHAAASSPIGKPPETIFSVSLDLSHYKVGDVIAIYALTRTDQGWASAGANEGKGRNANPTAAQSNVVNARTNPQWSHVHSNSIDGEGSLIKGRLDWFSVPVTIEIGPQPGFFEGKQPVEKSVRMSDEGYDPAGRLHEFNVVAYSLFMAVVVIAITVCCVFCREERDGTDVCSIWSEHRRISRQKISVDDFFKNEALELTTTSIS